MVEPIIEAYRLKDETRTGWELRGVGSPESVADHSWGTAFLVLVYAVRAGVDRARALEIAVVHDLAEAVTGDVATRVTGLDDAGLRRRKQQEEREGMARLTAGHAVGTANEIRELWEEYEASESSEALFVRDMNLIDMCLQAYVYERDRRYEADRPNEHFPDFAGLDEFFATTRPRLRTALGSELFREVADRYRELPSVAARGGLRLTPEPG
jgi:putative hydrolase of HD superfamily